MPIFPVVVAKDGVEFPERGTYFVVAANGAFVRKDVGLFEGLIAMPVKDVPGMVKVGYCIDTPDGPIYLRGSKATTTSTSYYWQKKKEDDEEDLTLINPLTGEAFDNDDEGNYQGLYAVEPYINMMLPKLPGEIIYRALLFFRKVYRAHKSEGVVIIAYNPDTKQYTLHCPKQEVSGGSISYDRRFYVKSPSGKLNPPADLTEAEQRQWGPPDQVMLELANAGFKNVGTIHSHPSFNAFHSGTDTGDEASFDGVHLTLGHVTDEHFSIASSLVLNDYREEVDAENVCLNLTRVGDTKAKKSYYISSGYQNYYDVDFEPDQLQKMKAEFEAHMDAHWMKKVSKKVWAGFGRAGFGSGSGWTGSRSGGTVFHQDFDDDDDDDDGNLIGGETYVQTASGVWVKESELEDFEEKERGEAMDGDAWENDEGDDTNEDIRVEGYGAASERLPDSTPKE